MKARILRVLEYEGEIEDLMADSLRWSVKGSKTWGQKGHEIIIREASMWPSGKTLVWQRDLEKFEVREDE